MTVSLSAMAHHHTTKRLPAPATTSSSLPKPLPHTHSVSVPISKHHHRPIHPRIQRCPSIPRLLHPFNLYRFLTVLVLISTPLVLLFVHFRPASLPHWQFWRRFSLHVPDVAYVRRLLRRALRLYQRQLHLHPLFSRAITAGVIFFIADISAQGLHRRPGKTCSKFSFPRLARYSCYGLLVMGPFLYIWYALMNEYGPEDDFRGSLLKCLFEQITLEPICISMYIIYDGLVCRRGFRAVKNSLDSQFFPLWFKNAIFWLPANFANYYIGTPDLRVVFANLCSLFWNIYFSAKVNKFAGQGFGAERGAKYLPLFNHDRDTFSTSASGSYQPIDTTTRRTSDSKSTSRLSTKTLIV